MLEEAERNSPRFSVCIRAYRRPQGLRRAIESALGQEVDDLEVVVSDDSGDMDWVVTDIGDTRVRYTRNPRPRGSIANLRRVQALARGEYVVALDDDDRLLPGFLLTAAAPMDRDPGIGVVFTGYLQEAGGHRKPYPFPVPGGAVRDPLRMVLAGCQPGRSSTLIRRRALEQGERRCPLLDDHVGDLTTWIRTAEAGWRFWAIQEPFAVVAIHRGQLSARENHERVIRTFERFRFEDPTTEAIRRTRLADARRRYALTLARRGKLDSARRELSAANAVAPYRTGEGWVRMIAGSLNVARPALHRFSIRHPRVGAVLRAPRRRRGAAASR